MATSMQGSSGLAAQVPVETGLGHASQAPLKALGGSLFGKVQHEPLVEYPAPVEISSGQGPALSGFETGLDRASQAPLGAVSNLFLGKMQHAPLAEYPAALREQPHTLPPDAMHRMVDVALSIALLLLLSPVMLCAALLVRVSGPGPIIFRHVRIGRNGAPFVCLKFRTMENTAVEVLTDLLNASSEIRREWERDQKIRRDPRVTLVGQFLRRYSVDELPQLINVLRGEMSIVGPRPIVDAEIHRYAEHFGVYCLVKPGLTGLWQVSGRNRLSYERRVELDCHYVQTRSLRGDAWIVARTIPAILHGSGC